ncbi:MAG: DsbE family thiol:disulfide interchange protein [Micropepsaceae bacterium]
MGRWLNLVPLAILLTLAGYFGAGLRNDPRSLPSVLLDRPLPTFDLPAIDAETPALSSKDLTNRVSLLNVFASWCPACRVEHPTLMALSEEKRISIYGLDWKDKPNERTAWLKELGNPYAAIGDDAIGRTAIDFGVTGAPETFVIDKHGRIRYKQIGPITDEVWSEVLEPLVRKLEAEK